jgi:uncharacterized membrane protein
MEEYPRRKRSARGRPEQIARGLAWFSVGIGIAQILAPRAIAKISGVPVPPALVVACGVRELACGIGLLTQDEAAPWVRARIAGDALDLAALGGGLLVPGADRRRIGVNAAVIGAIAAVDIYCSRDLASHGRRLPARHETLGIDVNRPADELYRFWRDVANLPLVMPHLKSVAVVDSTRSRWVAAGPGGTRIEWDSEIIDDVPNQRVAWRSLEGADVFNAGSVQFTPSGAGTRVRLELVYELPAGTVGGAIARLFGRHPAQEARADLDAFRQFMEKNPHNPRLMA